MNDHKVITQDIIVEIRNQYKLEWNGIHGAKHWARVRNNGLKLSQSTGANTKVIELFSFIHDSCRMSDGNDPDHGPRAALFAGKINANFEILSNDELDDLQDACIYHTRGFTSGYNNTILTCWDADRLDLGRVGIMPKPEYLCTDMGRQDEIIKWAYGNSISELIGKID